MPHGNMLCFGSLNDFYKRVAHFSFGKYFGHVISTELFSLDNRDC